MGGLLLPFTVRIGALVVEGVAATDSISAYYYTSMRDILVTTLVLVGVLLACYRTPDRRDAATAMIAGAAAIGIGLCPMDPVFAKEILIQHPRLGDADCYINRGPLGFHFIFVTVFFTLSFYLVYFRFQAFTPEIPTPQKLVRNRIYRICGLIMFASFTTIGALAIFNQGASIFWPETAAVIAFGVAWLIKGQIVLKDHAQSSPNLSPSLAT